MKSQPKLLDTFQIVGFIISTIISIVLIFVSIDPVISVILGLLLATLTQLFDLQLRHSESEERLLQAHTLSQELYRDEWLLKQVQQIVNDYYLVKNGWFNLFNLRAKASIEESRDVIHRMAEGQEMEVPHRSGYTFTFEGAKSAEKSLRAVTVDNMSYWRSLSSEKFLQTNTELTQRGVSIIRVFVEPKGSIRDIVDVLEKHKQAGVDVYVVYSEELKDQKDGFNIMDNRVVTHFQRMGDGRIRERVISTNPVEVDKMSKRFDIVMRYARKLDDVLVALKSSL